MRRRRGPGGGQVDLLGGDGQGRGADREGGGVQDQAVGDTPWFSGGGRSGAKVTAEGHSENTNLSYFGWMNI